jgi:hypothetical protein
MAPKLPRQTLIKPCLYHRKAAFCRPDQISSEIAWFSDLIWLCLSPSMSESLSIDPRFPHDLPEKWLRLILRQALKALVSGSRFLIREKALALAKLILPCLPYGKAAVVASILIEAYGGPRRSHTA